MVASEADPRSSDARSGGSFVHQKIEDCAPEWLRSMASVLVYKDCDSLGRTLRKHGELLPRPGA